MFERVGGRSFPPELPLLSQKLPQAASDGEGSNSDPGVPQTLCHTHRPPLSFCIHGREGTQGNASLPFTQHQPPSLHLPGIMLLAQVYLGHNELLCAPYLVTGGKFILKPADPL